MKGPKLLLCAFALLCGFQLIAQSPLPALKSSETSKQLIQSELRNLKAAYDLNRSTQIESKIQLFNLAMEFLNEATVIPPTVDYALTSAFLNHEVNRYNANDTEAFNRFYKKQWKQEFQDLVNLVKN